MESDENITAAHMYIVCSTFEISARVSFPFIDFMHYTEFWKHFPHHQDLCRLETISQRLIFLRDGVGLENVFRIVYIWFLVCATPV